jgi:hypothetical protein
MSFQDYFDNFSERLWSLQKSFILKIFITVIFIFLLHLTILIYRHESFVPFPFFSSQFTFSYFDFFQNLFAFIIILLYLLKYQYSLYLFLLVLSFSIFYILIVKLFSFYDVVINYVRLLDLIFFEAQTYFHLIQVIYV